MKVRSSLLLLFSCGCIAALVRLIYTCCYLHHICGDSALDVLALVTVAFLSIFLLLLLNNIRLTRIPGIDLVGTGKTLEEELQPLFREQEDEQNHSHSTAVEVEMPPTCSATVVESIGGEDSVQDLESPSRYVGEKDRLFSYENNWTILVGE